MNTDALEGPGERYETATPLCQGCRIENALGRPWIIYCPLHAAAGEMRKGYGHLAALLAALRVANSESTQTLRRAMTEYLGEIEMALDDARALLARMGG